MRAQSVLSSSPRAVARAPARHKDGLRVVLDHPRGEGDVGGAVRAPDTVGAGARDCRRVGSDILGFGRPGGGEQGRKEQESVSGHEASL